jgi:hypothetical protein
VDPRDEREQPFTRDERRRAARGGEGRAGGAREPEQPALTGNNAYLLRSNLKFRRRGSFPRAERRRGRGARLRAVPPGSGARRGKRRLAATRATGSPPAPLPRALLRTNPRAPRRSGPRGGRPRPVFRHLHEPRRRLLQRAGGVSCREARRRLSPLRGLAGARSAAGKGAGADPRPRRGRGLPAGSGGGLPAPPAGRARAGRIISSSAARPPKQGKWARCPATGPCPAQPNPRTTSRSRRGSGGRRKRTPRPALAFEGCLRRAPGRPSPARCR